MWSNNYSVGTAKNSVGGKLQTKKNFLKGRTGWSAAQASLGLGGSDKNKKRRNLTARACDKRNRAGTLSPQRVRAISSRVWRWYVMVSEVE